MQFKVKPAIKSLRTTVEILGWCYSYSLRKLPGLTIGFFILVLLTAFWPYLTNYLQAGLIDALLKQTMNQSRAIFTLPQAFVLLITALTVSRIFNFVRQYFSQAYSFDFAEILQYDVLEAYSRLDLEYWEDVEFNNKLRIVRNAYLHRTKNIIESSIWTVQDLISAIIAFFLLGSLSISLIIILMLVLIPPMISDIIHGRRLYGIWQADTKLQQQFYATANYLQNEGDLMEVRVYGLKKYFLKLIRKFYGEFKTKEKSLETRRALWSTILTCFSVVGFALALWVLVGNVLSGKITIGLLTFYISSIQQFSSSLSGFMNRISRLYEDSLFVKDVREVMEIKPKIISGKKKLSIAKQAPLIEFLHVDFKYPGTERFIFKDLNLRVAPGENVALIGENGAGKTTLVKLLCRFYDVTDGVILIDGVDIKDLDLESWYQKIAFLTQDYSRYHFDAQTNIGLGKLRKMKDKHLIESAAKLSNADTFIQEYPLKYRQVLNRRFENGISPSTGQWQKIALARAFFKDAPVLILDEPTSAIDPKAEYQIFHKIFSSFGLKKSILIISHRFSTVRNAHRILVMKSGKIIEQGSHEELYAQNGVYKKTFDLQKQAFE